MRGIIESGWRGGKVSKLCGKDVKMKSKFSVLIFISSNYLVSSNLEVLVITPDDHWLAPSTHGSFILVAALTSKT